MVELRLKIKGSQVQDSPVALSCDLELDILSFGLYEFFPGKRPNMTEKLLTNKNYLVGPKPSQVVAHLSRVLDL